MFPGKRKYPPVRSREDFLKRIKNWPACRAKAMFVFRSPYATGAEKQWALDWMLNQ
jgi:hypothetical protein